MAVAEAFALRVMRPLADKVRPVAVPVAAEVIVKETPLGMEAMVAPTGMPEPVIDWPMTNPVVLGTVIVVVLLVEAPVSVAAAAGMEAIVAPSAMPGPAIGAPTARPAVLVTWTLTLPVVVVAPLMKLPPAPSVKAEPVAVAFVLSTKAVPLVTDKTVAPAGMPAP